MSRKWNICLFYNCLINILLLCMSMLWVSQILSTSKLCGNYSLPQNFHIRKLGGISLFYGIIVGCYVSCWFSAWLGYKLIKPFHVFGLLLYLPEDIRKPLFLPCFQGVIKADQWQAMSYLKITLFWITV